MNIIPTFIPNMRNKKTRAKIRHAVGFAEMFLRDTKQSFLSRNLLNDRLGRSNNDLGAFLREHVITCVDERYSKDSGLTKAYVRNNSGVQYLKTLLAGDLSTTDKITTEVVDEYVNNQWAEELSTGDFIYKEVSERHHHAIQNLPKATRTRILAEWGYNYDYDIEAATITLLVQQARQLGMTNRVPTLQLLIDDKTAFRTKLADELDITVSAAKELIAAIVNGAKVGVSNRYRSYCVFDILGKDIARVRAITGIDDIKPNTTIAEFRRDMKSVWTALRPMIGASTRVKTTTGYRNKPITSGQKAYIYRLLETQVMDVVSDYLNDMLEVKHFRIHDGFAASEDIDTTELSDWVFNKTGFNVKFSCVISKSTPIANAPDVSIDGEASSPSMFSSSEFTQYNNVHSLHYSVQQLYDMIH